MAAGFNQTYKDTAIRCERLSHFVKPRKGEEKNIMEMHGTTVEEHRTMDAIQCINQKIPELKLRDLFAMHALNGMIINANVPGKESDFARWAYEYADAMLEARKEK